MVDKNKAVVAFLLNCPYIKDNPVFYNFGKVASENKQIVTLANDARTNVPYIDGSVRKRYTFTLIDYKSIVDRAILQREGVSDENLDNAFEAQQIVDWVNEQSDLRNYPNFGTDCVIDDMVVGTDQPNITGIDRAVTPTLAKYSISIRIDYIDYSKAIWK